MFDGNDYEPEMEECPECGDSFKSGAGIAAHRRLRHGESGKSSSKSNPKPVGLEKDIAVGIRKFASTIEQDEIQDAIVRRSDAISDAIRDVFKATDVGDSVMGKLAGEASEVKLALIRLGIVVAPIIGVAFLTVVWPKLWPRRRPLLDENGNQMVDLTTGEPLSISKDGTIWLKGKAVGTLTQQPEPATA